MQISGSRTSISSRRKVSRMVIRCDGPALCEGNKESMSKLMLLWDDKIKTVTARARVRWITRCMGADSAPPRWSHASTAPSRHKENLNARDRNLPKENKKSSSMQRKAQNWPKGISDKNDMHKEIKSSDEASLPSMCCSAVDPLTAAHARTHGRII